MKLLAIIIMLVALYLLYRIAFPSRREIRKEEKPPQKEGMDTTGVVVRKRFVRPAPGQPRTTRATSGETGFQQEKPDIFAAGNEKREAAISPGKPHEVPNGDPDPGDLDIEPDEDETYGMADEDEEYEDFEDPPQAPGEDPRQAGGWSIEEMAAVVEATQNPADGNAAILYRAEKTDMFEQLVSGDRRKAEMITAIIERHVSGLFPEDADEGNGMDDLENFDVALFLG